MTQLDERAFDNLQFYAAVPAVVGLDTVGGSQVVLGLRPTWLYFPESLAWPAENVFSMGGSLGYAFRASPRLRIMPEVSVLLPLGPMPTDDMRAAGSRPHLQLGLAFMFDSAGNE